MASITQSIPSYIQGISEQPDELKLPGQVRDALNVLPDVTKGLMKRPGARLINPLTTTKEGSWFHIYRTETDQYIGNVARNGIVNIWSCFDGMPRIVTYQDTPFSLYPNNPIQGSTGVTNRPGFASCNTAALETAINNLRIANTLVTDKRKEIDAVQLQIEALELAYAEPKTYLAYSPKRQNAEPYTVTEGQVIYEAPFATKPLTIDYRKPQVSTDEVVTIADKPVIKNKLIKVGNVYGNAVGLVRGSIYAWVVKPKTAIKDNQTLKNLQAQKETLKAELKPLLDSQETAQKAYELASGNCGIFATPYSVNFKTPKATTSQAPNYLKHTVDEDLQFLTVNDYTFITNRSSTVTMSGSKEEGSPYYKAFVTLDQIVGNKVYALNIYSTSNPTPVTTTTATKLKIVDHTDFDKSSSCPNQGSKIIDKNEAGKTNLRFELRVLGSSRQKNENDPYKGFVCDYYSREVNLINGGEGWKKGDTVKAELEGVTYTIEVAEVERYTVLADIAQVRPPATSSSSTEIIRAETLLNSIKTEVEKTPYLFAEVIANGILIYSQKPFNIDTPEKQLMSIMTDSVNNVSRLPQQCQDGYVVKVVNSAENEDDYYLRFETRNPGVNGEGVWVETTKPGIQTSLNSSSMPHQIVFDPNANAFVVSPVDWEPRLVGDDVTNPKPSFVGKTINKILFFRNRLVLLSDENVVMSRPGDYWNFWAKTALTVTAADVIDISASSTYPAILYDGIEVNAGLLLFSPNQQFLLTTDNDLLTPETVKINTVSSYQYNVTTQPISMGTTVGFLNNAGMNARLFEMTNILREGEVEVLEQSKQISEKLPVNLNQLADSRENNLLICGTKDRTDVWGFRYFNSGTERIQSAWFRWELTGNLVYHCIMRDVYYAVLSNVSDASGNTIISLQRFDLKNTDWTAIVEDADHYPYTVHMDNYRVVLPNELQYYPHLNQTYFRLPMGYFKPLGELQDKRRFAAYTLKRGKFQGRATYPTIEIDSLGTWAVFEGDWSDTRLMIGYEFEMDVELPTIYYQRQEGNRYRSDTRSSLIIHRLKLNFGTVGVYETTIERKGRPDYTQLYESREQDGYNADAVAFVQHKTQTVPCYERNHNLTVHIKSNHPSPAIVHSMSWEGDLTNMYYTRV